MYYDTFKYPSEWTEDWQSYDANRPYLCKAIIDHMTNYETRLPMLKKQTNDLSKYFFSANKLLKNIK
jgi:hypothetical protein